MPDLERQFKLCRRVRFCVEPRSQPVPAGTTRHNSFAAWPPMRGLGAFYELEVACRGAADPGTGFLLNIKVVDEAVRSHAVGVVAEAFREGAAPEATLCNLVERLQVALEGRLARLRWWLPPYYSLAMNAADTDRVLLAQRFEFCAAHRLHSPQLSDEENRRVFGKCNLPGGHGHNYRVEPTVSVSLAGHEPRVRLADLERIVDECVIQRFDHRNLNSDVDEFSSLSPTVENIARVCFGLLEPPIAGLGGRLEQVTVWETDKTSCTYPARV